MTHIRNGLLLFLATALPAAAQEWVNCQASAGDPVRVVDFGPNGVRPFEIVTALASRTIGSPLVLQDSAGRGIGGGTIELALPEEPADLQFVQLGPGVTPKRAVVELPDSCVAYLPQMIGSADAGTAIAMLRVSGRGAAIPVPVRAIAVSSWVARDGGIVPYVVALGQSAGGGAYVEWSDGQHFGPLAGVAITIRAPDSDPTIRFANGSNVIVVHTDSTGGGGASGITTSPGTIDIRSTYPDGSLASLARHVVLRAPDVAVTTAQTVEYGVMPARVRGIVRHTPFDCDLPGHVREQLWSEVRFRVGPIELADARMGVPAYECAGNVLTFPISASLAGLPFGSYEITADLPAGVLAAASSAPSQVVIAPSRTVQAATGRGRIQVGSADPGYAWQAGKCVVRDSQALSPAALGPAAPGPEAVELPYGALRIALDQCQFTSNIDFIPPPLPPSAQVVLLELDEEPAPGTIAFAYGPTAQRSQPHWYELRTSVAGRLVQFEVVDGGLGDQGGRDEAITSLVTLGVPRHAAIAGSFQDLWWAGPEENGWGMSIMQHRDVMFGALFIYDASGNPRWLVMPGGAWNAERTAYSGSLYSPRGSQDHATLPSAFVPGLPVGTIRLTPSSRDAITLEYTVGGVSGSKQLTRQPFGPVHPHPTLRFDDMWWAGMAQNGWGFAVAQQFRNYFGVIYTYDSQGEPTWYVAPSLTASPGHDIAGPLYRTRGSSWVGATYDPGALSVAEVGTLRLQFEGAEQGQLIANIAGRPDIGQPITRQPF